MQVKRFQFPFFHLHIAAIAVASVNDYMGLCIYAASILPAKLRRRHLNGGLYKFQFTPDVGVCFWCCIRSDAQENGGSQWEFLPEARPAAVTDDGKTANARVLLYVTRCKASALGYKVEDRCRPVVARDPWMVVCDVSRKSSFLTLNLHWTLLQRKCIQYDEIAKQLYWHAAKFIENL